MFALVDCNNFYASCERLFRPDLKGRPIVVLSNNDGCVIARSAEAKKLGIKMGVPAFQIRDLVTRHGIVIFSSNYALYADMSQRVVSVLEAMAPQLEVYSIDESFVGLAGMDRHHDLTMFGRSLQQQVFRWTGLPVGVGIGTTKTLAKLANYAAKKYSATHGVVNLCDPLRRNKLLALTPVDNVWGVGRRLKARLQVLGIHTAGDLAQACPAMIRTHFSVVLERTLRELNGESCLALEDAPPKKQEIVSSRSFGERITDFDPMRAAITHYALRAAEKLRGENQWTRSVTVFLRTSPHTTQDPFYSQSATGTLSTPTNDSRIIATLAHRLLKRIWKDGYRYMKAGVLLSDFSSPAHYQTQLFDCSPQTTRRSEALMRLMDKLNRQKRGQLFLAAGMTQGWSMKRDFLSPGYTTRWADIPRVR